MTATDLILLRNAQVYAPAPLGTCEVLLGGGRILWLGRDALELPGALAVRTLDLQGQRLIPGLVDGHVHVTGGGGEAGFRSRVPPQALSRFTRAGVTTVVGLLGTDDVVRTPRELLAQVHALREEGLSAYAYVGGYHLPPATLTGSVRGDLVLIEPLIGVGEVAISDHRSSQPGFDELMRVAADAHVAGLMTGKAGILHLHLGDGARGLDFVRRALAETELPARTFQPTHVNRRKALFDEALELARQGVHIDVTAFPVDEGEDAWDAVAAFLRYQASGAPAERLSISSDAGGSLPCFDGDGCVVSMEVGESGALLATLRGLLAQGVPLEQALPPFTSNPARLLRLAGKGHIAVGADADLVALDAAGNAQLVIARGAIHLQDGRVCRHGWFEAR
ncbi:MAG: beta-aspartyl-peptidase [Dokdonella sp.]|uniref:beta-aspartyl-peptidase n=1 Tax=Dokdonella sp. TaxID=2291710 RepID=UPI0025BB85F5|nr:beta-aspartyl-peptidase [Dokdonella sp.]MBX3699864.1 beta-aspartyl-peptidase [Dokdonella sp.]